MTSALAAPRVLRLHTIALGCQMSAADGAEMSAPFERRGFAQAAGPEDADAILISTCTVRQHAEDRALSLIGSLRPWKEADPNRLLVVGGCAAERLGAWLRARFPYVDLVVGAKSISEFPALVEQALRARFDGQAEERDALPPDSPRFLETGSPATAFVTIMRGCNYSCSYCIVPAVRGRELYRPAEEILSEVRAKISAGARELTLLGQTVNSYASTFEGRPVRFDGLLRLVDAVPNLLRLRFMSPHPHYAGDDMLSALAQCRTACELLHMPAQSGSDRVLKAMRRNYTRASFLARIEAARRKVPGVVFSTDIIVGFPTETEEDFQSTLSLLREMGPVSAYCFKYSPREGTESASLPDDVPQGVKEDRLRRLNELVDAMTQEALRARVGRDVEVLAEQRDFGRTRDGFKVRWDRPVEPGTLQRVRVASATRRTLMGEIP